MEFEGTLTAAGVESLDVVPWLVPYLEGRAPFNARMEIRERADRYEISPMVLNSSLQGLHIHLPRPLGKRSLAKLPLRLELPLEEQDTRMMIELGQKLRIRRPQVEGPAMELQGRISELDLGDWEDFLADAGGGLELDEGLFLDDFRIERLRWQDVVIEGVGIDLQQAGESMELRFRHPFATGRLILGVSPAQLMFRELDVGAISALVEGEESAAEADDATDTADLLEASFWEQIPQFQVEIEKLHSFHEKDYGWWRFRFDSAPGRLELGEIYGVGPGIDMSAEDNPSAQLTWLETGQGQWTRLRVAAELGDVSDLLRVLDSAPILTSEKGLAEARVQWPGAPWELSIKGLTGDVSVSLYRGWFHDLGGFARQTLGALRTLDLESLFDGSRFSAPETALQGGLLYQQIDGSFTMDEGLLLIRDKVHVQAEEIELHLAGLIDLVGDATRAKLLVNLKVSKGLPWLAALLGGGLPVLVGTYALGKLLSDPLRRLSTVSYEITGPWENLQFNLAGIFSGQDSLIELLDGTQAAEEQAEPSAPVEPQGSGAADTGT